MRTYGAHRMSFGCEVVAFPGAPLSFKAEGGPTCLTRPILRDPE